MFWYNEGYHFSGNLEMSGNLAKVSEKAPKLGKSQGKVGEFL